MLEITESCNLQTANHGSGSCGLSNTERPIVRDRQMRGTRPVRLICTLFKIPLAISAYRISQFAPALSGLPPDPAPPLCLAQRMAKLAAPSLFSRGVVSTRRLALLGARSALHAPGVVVLDWRYGVGRLSRTTRTPKKLGSLGG